MIPKFRIKVLHFTDGIGPLGGAMTISNGVVAGGPRATRSIRRVKGGYLIDWTGVGGQHGLYIVHDAQILAVEVVDPEAVEEEQAEDDVAVATRVRQTAKSLPRAARKDSFVAAIATPKAEAKPGDIVVDERGVMSRVPFPKNDEAAPRLKKTKKKVVHAMTRSSGRVRRGGPTAPLRAPADDDDDVNELVADDG
jgi:hypothetical protein